MPAGRAGILAALDLCVASSAVEKQPITESLGGRPRATEGRPHAGNKVKRFVVGLARELVNDNITDVGAMMAYYAILALFPMLVFVVTLALLVLPDDVVLQGLAMATEAMPPATAEVVTTQVVSLMKAAHTGFAIGSAALALWGASRGASSLMGALNAMFNKQETRPWWRRQVIAIAVTFGVAIVVVLALGLLVAGPVAGHWLADRFGLGSMFDTAWGIGRWAGAGLLVMVVWAVLYKFLPDTNAPFRIFTPGAIVGVLLWLGISYGFRLYLGHFNSYEATYGALGGGIIFLTWLWLSNIAILFGAEINDVLADVRRETSPAAAMLAHESEFKAETEHQAAQKAEDRAAQKADDKTAQKAEDRAVRDGR
ncbi:MAG: YihY/virulence factor BrkB family protein [Deltaproteobacteria bacterium]|nr:MAG: YihY/virulence factor BrkB family protein [Deltaproteobacteria bacterium]